MKNKRRERKQTSRHIHDQQADTSPAKMLSVSIIIGLGCSATAIIFMAICSLYILSKEDPEKTISVLSIIIPATCYMTSGFISHRLSRRSPLICGSVSAATLMTALKFTSFICNADARTPFSAPIKIALAILYAFLSVVSALLSANLYSSSKKRKRSATRKK